MEPLPIDLAQPYPYPYRPRGAVTDTLEIRYAIHGKVVSWYRWTLVKGSERTGFESGSLRRKSEAEAKKALDQMIKGTIDMGWVELPEWPAARGRKQIQKPMVSLDLEAARSAAPAPKKTRAPKRKPVPFAKVKLTGAARGAPSNLEELTKAFKTALPESYRKWIAKNGLGMFAGRLQFLRASLLIKRTRQWRKFWTLDGAREVWSNIDATLGAELGKMVFVAGSIDGDYVGFLAGAPETLYIVPRHSEEIVRCRDLTEVFGYFLAVAEGADGPGARPTFSPSRK